MRSRVEYSAAARRALAFDLPEGVAAAAFEFIEGALSENPHRVGKALRGPLTGLHSARRGDYRVLYEIHDDRVVVRVVRVGHRRSAYRRP
ncbi:type II toxin-antitoxin system RelE family toxin [Aquipuribacter sp. SD81]|uniref:type II toxin-antitoxin system RelE family toxin n=1 Tax=Aquipuribacter sp. SD81 TaxID=3127703 RepID=UPI00301ABA61